MGLYTSVAIPQRQTIGRIILDARLRSGIHQQASAI